jgi:3-oxoacyl-[acyl-carrier protein] reductase
VSPCTALSSHGCQTQISDAEAGGVIPDGGRIVNISTRGTHLAFPEQLPTLEQSRAHEQFTKGLAHELASRGVTMNAVGPGCTDTAVLWESFRDTDTQMTPFGRLGKPRDIAGVVVFLVSDPFAGSPFRLFASGGAVTG